MSERRRFFRINDRIGIAYRQLEPAEVAALQAQGLRQVEVGNLLAACDQQIAALLPELRAAQPQLAELLSALNKKLDAVIAQLELDSRLLRQVAHKVREASISACGMAFVVEEAVATGSLLSLDLLLQPQGREIAVIAQVTGCEPVAQGYYLRLDFQGLQPQEQEQLIQHIVKRQGHLIREQKHPQEPPKAP